jgi:peroxiredoxin
LEQYERRAFVDGEKSQFITYYFTDYELRKDAIDFGYELPEGYVTQIAGNKVKIRPLAEGTDAPGFESTDMSGKPVNLSFFTGQKVLLNFSIINCGWCKTALDHFNREDFQLSENIKVLYINPVDSKAQVEKYVEKFHVPFPVIAEAKAVGESYRVNGYPTFYLIDEEGKIEKVQSGYQKDFINNLGR